MAPVIPTRDKITQAAISLFAQRGYFGVSMQDLAKELEVSKAALYYHFPSKDRLFLTVLESVFGDLFSEVTLAAKKSRNPAEAVIKVLETYFSFSLERPEAQLLKTHQTQTLDREIRQRLISANRQLRLFFEELFDRAARQEQTQKEGLRELTHTLMLLWGAPMTLARKKGVRRAVASVLGLIGPILKSSKQ